MQSVGIKVLKNRLSEYVRAAASGETVLVTDHGRVVAELVAPRVPDESSPADRRLAELVRRGLVTPARRALDGAPPRVPVAHCGQLLAELAADRAER